MKDWSEYLKVVSEAQATTGERPKVGGYILIKITDNSLIIVLILLTLIFSGLGLFLKCDTPDKTSWAFHAADLCLGVFLGVISTRYKTNRK
ncbi:MAG TPA: hypothetical protein VFP20_00030 [Bacteroidales bacterium]|nr:hypothetical protein [Bacteroidales bacterium]